MTENTQIADQNEYYVTALSLAQSVLDEAKTKAYDEYTVNRTYALTKTDSLTLPSKLGREWGEQLSVPDVDTITTSSPFTPSSPGYRSTTQFDDVDDYNGYQRLVNTPRAEGYRIRVSVQYASPTCPDSAVSTKTWCKTMTVQITSPYFRKQTVLDIEVPDTLVLSYAFLY
jgi:hypothetical protein